jgi:hypothetical protein
MRNKQKRETPVEVPAMPPVYFHNGCWQVVVPGPTSTAGSNLFRGAKLEDLIRSIQLGYFHAVWAIHNMSTQNKALKAALASALRKNSESSLEAALKQNSELLSTILKTKGTR